MQHSLQPVRPCSRRQLADSQGYVFIILAIKGGAKDKHQQQNGGVPSYCSLTTWGIVSGEQVIMLQKLDWKLNSQRSVYTIDNYVCLLMIFDSWQ